MGRQKSAWIALGLALSLLVTACSSGNDKAKTPAAGTEPSAQTSKGAKVLTLGYTASPDSFSPITNKTQYGTIVYSLFYPSLYAMNDKLEYEPRLAESYTVNEAQDLFTFKLRKDAKWTDGKPITAHDVAYTFQVIAHPDTPTSRRSLLDTLKGLDGNGVSETKDFGVSGIKVVDDHTLELSTKKPVDLDSFMEKIAAGLWIMPKHVLEPAVQADLKGLDKADHVMKPTVFGGPFKLVEYVTDSHIELAPNETYFLGKPKLDKLFVKIVGQASLAAAIEKGEIDVPAGIGVGEVPIADWDRVSKLPTVTPIPFVGPAYQYLDFNHANPAPTVFANRDVREAFAHAINRDLIVKRLMKGEAEVVNTPLNSANKYYSQELQSKLEYNPQKAKEMLTKAGWDFSKEVVLVTPTGNVVREQSADIIQANLAEIGVKVKIEKVDFPTRQARSKAGQFDLSLAGFSATFDPDFSSQVITGGAFNDRKYTNPTMDQLAMEGKGIAKFDEKKAHYGKLQELFVQEVPFVPLYSAKALVVVNNRVIAAKPGPNGLTWNAHLWDVK
jgi:peptide/nickel transport system substrate-binding protein